MASGRNIRLSDILLITTLLYPSSLLFSPLLPSPHPTLFSSPLISSPQSSPVLSSLISSPQSSPLLSPVLSYPPPLLPPI